MNEHIIDFIGGDIWDGPYTIRQCVKALSPSRLPGMNYALNPYKGCVHGCVYCYAPEVTHSEWKDWRHIEVKINIAERLGKELRNISGTVGIGTVTDPYQAPEERFMLTRSCLEVLRNAGFPVIILTKSDLVLRDMDMISAMRHNVGVTVTTVDDRISKMTEPGAPLPSVRFSTLKRLVESGIQTTALVGPIMSSLKGNEKEFAQAILDTGVRYASVDRLNPRPLLSERLSRMNIGECEPTVELVKRYLREGGMTVDDAF